jgi:hypothetical protein
VLFLSLEAMGHCRGSSCPGHYPFLASRRIWAAEAGGFSGGSDKDNVKNLARLNLFHSFTTMIWSQSTRSSFLPLKVLGNLRDTQVSHFCVVSVKS